MAYVVTSLGTSLGTSGNRAITTSVNVPAGSLLVAVAGESAATVVGSISVAGGVGGPFSLKNNAQNNGANGMGQVWTIDKTNAQINSGAVITFTPSVSSHNSTLGLFFVTGTDGNAPVVNATPAVGGTSPASTGAVTVSVDQLVLGFSTMQAGVSSSWTQDVNSTNAFPFVNGGLNTQGIISGYQTAASTSVTYSTAQSTNRAWASFMLGYNPAVISVTIDSGSRLESTSSSSEDVTSGSEALSFIRVDDVAMMEGLLFIRTDWSFLDEILSSVRGERLVPFDYLNNYSIDASSETEFVGVMSLDSMTDLEILTGIKLDVSPRSEVLESLKSDADASTIFEYLNSVKTDGASRAENLAVILRDAVTSLEMTSSARVDTSDPIDWLHAAITDSSLPLENLANVNVVVSDGGVVLEFLAGVAKDAAASLEAISSVRREESGQVEWFASFLADYQGGLEFVSLMSWNSIVVIEELMTFAKDNASRLEFQVSARSDDVSRAEFLAQITALSADSQIQLSWTGLVAVSAEGLAQVEFIKKLLSDSSVSIESLRSIFVFMADGSLPLEFNISVTIDAGMPIELLKFAVLRPNHNQLYSGLDAGLGTIGGF